MDFAAVTITVFWDVTPYSLVYVSRRFGRITVDNRSNVFLRKVCKHVTRLHGVTSQHSLSSNCVENVRSHIVLVKYSFV
jgi:hypothetical protein